MSFLVFWRDHLDPFAVHIGDLPPPQGLRFSVASSGELEAPLSQRERDIWERGRLGIIGSSLRIISGLGIICGTVQHWYFVVLASGKTTTTTTTTTITTSQAQKIFIPRICIDDTRVLFLRREHCRRTAGNVCRL